MYWLRPPRYLDLSWAKFDAERKAHRLIHKSDLSTADARRSREVSPQEFERIRAKGAVQYAHLQRRSAPTTGLDKNWDSINEDAFAQVSKDWGGATYDAHTGEKLPDKLDAYALTVRPPGMDAVSIPEGSNKADFRKAMRQAKQRYQKILERANHHLGVFHDNDKGTIDIDPVVTVPTIDKVESIGAYTRATGGAYHFKSGNGFWPPHVADEKKVA